MERLRIALVAPPWFAVPPTGYGGIERVVSLLADGLVERGHDVTLFASGGSVTSARLVSTFKCPPSEQLGDWTLEAMAVSDAYARHCEFDVIHDHTAIGPIFAPAIQTPVVHTIHGTTHEAARLYAHLAQRLNYVCISADQASSMPSACSTRVIYNGVDVDAYPMNEDPDDYLVFVGRMSPEKGILDAIEIARRTTHRLLVLAKVNEAPEREYFRCTVLPALRGIDAEVLEQPPHEVKVRAYQNAVATLFPIHWREPFGLVMVESMSAGTPVIAYRNGSVAEVVRHGETGYVCDSLGEAVTAVASVRSLSRRACRDHAETQFSAARMVDAHAAMYAELARGGGGLPRRGRWVE